MSFLSSTVITSLQAFLAVYKRPLRPLFQADEGLESDFNVDRREGRVMAISGTHEWYPIDSRMHRCAKCGVLAEFPGGLIYKNDVDPIECDDELPLGWTRELQVSLK